MNIPLRVVSGAALAAVALAVLLNASAARSASNSPVRSALQKPAGPAAVASSPLAVEIFRQLIEIDTTDSSGSTTHAAEAIAERLKAAGFPEADVQVLGPHPRKGNLVARLRGRGEGRPILLLGHLDVVEARRDDWSVEPFRFLERDGYYYGRGTTDMKDICAAWIAALIRFRREGFTPDRDIIVALTADEEGGEHNGVDWLIRNHRALVDAEYCLNEGGDGEIREGRYVSFNVKAAEKVYLTYTLEAKNPGGHSSLPVRDNAIYHIAGALTRLAAFDFPVRLNEVTRSYFRRMARIQQGQLAADMLAVTQPTPDRAAVERLSRTPNYNAMMRTTCVATMMTAGHAENALPQLARAKVNCRLLPDESPADVLKALVQVVGDAHVSVTPDREAEMAPPSSLKPEVVQAIDALVASMWPGVPVVHGMSTGATDGRILRKAGIPAYGIGAFGDIEENRAHGRDERIGIPQFNEEVEFLYRLVKTLAGGAKPATWGSAP